MSFLTTVERDLEGGKMVSVEWRRRKHGVHVRCQIQRRSVLV